MREWKVSLAPAVHLKVASPGQPITPAGSMNAAAVSSAPGCVMWSRLEVGVAGSTRRRPIQMEMKAKWGLAARQEEIRAPDLRCYGARVGQLDGQTSRTGCGAVGGAGCWLQLS
eukprot:SAG22_NODE_385_length_11304_cov_21.304775_13_plen_114_part_00